MQPLPESRLISLSKQAGLSSLNLHAAEAPVTRVLGFLQSQAIHPLSVLGRSSFAEINGAARAG